MNTTLQLKKKVIDKILIELNEGILLEKCVMICVLFGIMMRKK